MICFKYVILAQQFLQSLRITGTDPNILAHISFDQNLIESQDFIQTFMAYIYQNIEVNREKKSDLFFRNQHKILSNL